MLDGRSFVLRLQQVTALLLISAKNIVPVG